MQNRRSLNQPTLILSFIYILLLPSNWNSPPSCQAEHHNNQGTNRLLINLFADVSELLQHIPQHPVIKGILTPVVTRTQNELVTNPNFNEIFGKSTLLSNNLDDVRFLVFNNHRKPNSSFDLDVDRGHSSFDYDNLKYVRPYSSIKILIHGYNYEDTDRFPVQTKDAYLFTTPHPVIWVDWRELATPRISPPALLYPAVADNVQTVGKRVFHLIEFLLRNGIVAGPKGIHLIGHSLGAHIAGRAGQLVFMRHGVKVGRITGLDAAGPLFTSLGPNFVLDSSDARFVDGIHSSFSGIGSTFGHADFYPNGGQLHPHCLNLSLSRIISCNHAASFEYFTRSIYDRDMIACGCANYQDFRQGSCGKYCREKAVFGEYVSHRARGKFFLDYDLNEDYQD